MAPVVTMIVPPGRIPSVDSDVAVVSGAVPVATAGVAFAVVELVEELELLLELDEEDVLEDPSAVDDTALVSPTSCNACCIADESWELTRLSAVPLARLDSPFDSSSMAVPITLICDAWALDAADCACAWDQ